MKPGRLLFNTVFIITIIVAVTAVQFCSKKQKDDSKSLPAIIEQKDLSESYRKTGWLEEDRYRAVVYVITREECQSNPGNEIEEKVKLEAFKQLQKELNPAFNRNASVQVKSLIDKYGKVITAGQSCIDSNVYFFDVEKKDLKTDFINIKNLK